MTVYVALLRAINVGGTGKLPMSELRAICEDAGFKHVKTYIASGNVVFSSDRPRLDVKSALKSRLEAVAGREVGVIVLTGKEIDSTMRRNPFPGHPGNKVIVVFTEEALQGDLIAGLTGRDMEEVRLFKNELFIYYPDGIGQSKLRTPIDKAATARNMNTVHKLAEMATALA